MLLDGLIVEYEIQIKQFWEFCFQLSVQGSLSYLPGLSVLCLWFFYIFLFIDVKSSRIFYFIMYVTK